MQKAILKFSPLESAYCEKYGLMPDRHFEKLLEQLHDADKVGKIINNNMSVVWQELKEKSEPVDKFVPVKTTPF